MNSSQIFSLIESVAAQPKKNLKVAMLTEHADDAELRRTLDAALNPFKRYGVKSLPERTGAGTLPMGAAHWSLLDQLVDRTITGHAARAAIQFAFDELDPGSAALLGRILRKDLRAGFSESTTNKVFPKLLPEFPYMRCALPTDKGVDLAKWPWADGVLSQLKADGMFANVSVEENGLVDVTSRQGSPLPLSELGALSDHLACLNVGFQYHGELLVQTRSGPDGAWKNLPREESNGALNAVIKGGELEPGQRVVYQAWDMIPLSSVKPKGRYEVPYKKRFTDLQMMIGEVQAAGHALVEAIPTRIVYSLAEAMIHYRENIAAKFEGSILKRPDAIWRDGDSKQQVKLKVKVTVELMVTGFNEGDGKNVGALGSFQCTSSCGLLKVDVSGRGDKMRADVWADKEGWLLGIIAVEANDILAPKKVGDPYSLFLPIFAERRLDKSVADSLERIQAQFAAAVAA